MFTVEFETGNDAFTGGLTAEVSACLERVNQRIMRDGLRRHVEMGGGVQDTNGNIIGRWRWTPDVVATEAVNA